MRFRNTSKIFSVLFFVLSFAFVASARPTEIIKLWDGYDVHNGDKVNLYCYVPDEPNGVSIIVCPGGSYYWLDIKGEGYEVGEFLKTQGITAFVLSYRAAGVPAYVWRFRAIFRGNRYPDCITDAQRALQYVSEHTGDYGIDDDKIGMMGFSAGGHLVMSCACFSTTNFLAPMGIEPQADLRPAFVAPIYPVVTLVGKYTHQRSRSGLLGENRQASRKMRDSLSLQFHIPDNCPPVFIANCKDDPVVDYHNSEILDEALTEAGADHKYIQYEAGKHGFGVSNIYGTPESRQWKYEFIDWLSNYYEL